MGIGNHFNAPNAERQPATTNYQSSKKCETTGWQGADADRETTLELFKMHLTVCSFRDIIVAKML